MRLFPASTNLSLGQQKPFCALLLAMATPCIFFLLHLLLFMFLYFHECDAWLSPYQDTAFVRTKITCFAHTTIPVLGTGLLLCCYVLC